MPAEHMVQRSFPGCKLTGRGRRCGLSRSQKGGRQARRSNPCQHIGPSTPHRNLTHPASTGMQRTDVLEKMIALHSGNKLHNTAARADASMTCAMTVVLSSLPSSGKCTRDVRNIGGCDGASRRAGACRDLMCAMPAHRLSLLRPCPEPPSAAPLPGIVRGCAHWRAIVFLVCSVAAGITGGGL